jgi:hypothetical protein
MKNLQNSDIRLTDALERQLLQEAIDNQQRFAFERALEQFFIKISGLFKAPVIGARHTPHAAH